MCADSHSPSRPEPGWFEDDWLEERLIEALAAGDAVKVAEYIREMKTIGPAGASVLADLLDGGLAGEPVIRGLFPHRLRFRKWGKGRLKSLPDWRRARGIIAFVKDCLHKGMEPKNAIKMAAENFGVSITIVRSTLKKGKATNFTT
jgi:hypothetical protein